MLKGTTTRLFNRIGAKPNQVSKVPGKLSGQYFAATQTIQTREFQTSPIRSCDAKPLSHSQTRTSFSDIRSDYRYVIFKSGVLTGAVITIPGVIASFYTSNLVGILGSELSLATLVPLWEPFKKYGGELAERVLDKVKILNITRDYHKNNLLLLKLKLLDHGKIVKKDILGTNLEILTRYGYFNQEKFDALSETASFEEILDSMNQPPVLIFSKEVDVEFIRLAGIGVYVAVFLLFQCFLHFLQTEKSDVKPSTPSPEEIQPKPKDVISNGVATHRDYQRSHWYGKLEAKIKELSSPDITKPGHPVICVINGIGGCGKTQLARDYGNNSRCSVVWSFSADDDPENLWQNYCTLATKLGVTTRKPEDVDEKVWRDEVRSNVNKSLAAHPKWVLIFDNVRELKEIEKFLPNDGKQQEGIILITTTNGNLMPNNCLPIGSGLNVDLAISILRKSSGIEIDSNDTNVVALADELDRLPLNLLISGAVIAKRKRPNPYAEYREHLQKLSATQLQKEQEDGLKSFPANYNRTQYAVISDAMEQLGKSNPEARELLEFCSYLSPTNIPRGLLEKFVLVNLLPTNIVQRLWNKFQGRNEISSDDLISSKCDELLSVVRESLLLQETPDGSAFDIHRVTQQVGKIENISRRKANNILKSVLFPFNKDADYMGYEDLPKEWKMLLPHMIEIASNKQLLQLIQNELVFDLMRYVGYAFHDLWNDSQAIYYLHSAVKIGNGEFGEKSLKVASVLTDVAIVYLGESVVRRASKNDIMIISLQPKRVIQAKVLLEHALAIQEFFHKDNKKYRPLSKTLKYLGLVYLNGLNHAQKDIETRLRDYNNLKKDTHYDCTQAKYFFERALIMDEEYYGSNSLFVAQALDFLSQIYEKLGDSRMVEKLLRRILAIEEIHYGESLKVADTLKELAYNSIESSDNLLQRKEWFERRFAIEEVHDNNKYQEFVSDIEKIQDVVKDLVEKSNNIFPDEVKEELKGNPQSVATLARIFASDRHHKYRQSWRVVSALSDLVKTHEELGNIQQAKELLEHRLVIEEVHYDKEYSRIIEILNYLSKNIKNPQLKKLLLDRKLAIEALEKQPQIDAEFVQSREARMNAAVAATSLF